MVRNAGGIADIDDIEGSCFARENSGSPVRVVNSAKPSELSLRITGRVISVRASCKYEQAGLPPMVAGLTFSHTNQ